jgi:adhesin/invasin
MLTGSMITRPNALLAVLAAGALSLLVSACEKVPLLAPAGSTIILTASTNVLPANGATDIVAQVLEAAGTAPHSGTLVTFTTTLGVLEPSEARTDIGGRAIVRFRASGVNGNATIIASSGGATTGSNGAIKIAIGTAAVGSVRLGANPSTVSANGGVATLTAGVVDVNGNALVGVPVSFSTTAGSLRDSVVNTDGGGIAETTLTTSVQATVTATVGVQAPATGGTGGTGGTGTGTGGSTSGQASATVTVNVNPLPTVSVTPPGGTLTANSPIVFTVTVAPGASSTAQIKEVIINFGDGASANLGAISGTTTVQHEYPRSGTYTVRVTATDTLGGVTSAATVIVVRPEPPLSVTISYTKATSGPVTTVTFTATVTPNTATVASYLWDFGDGTPPFATSSNQVVHPYSVPAVYTVTVTVTTTTGQSAVGQTGLSIP